MEQAIIEQTIKKHYSADKEVLENVAFEDLLISKSISGFGVVSHVDVLKHMYETLKKSGLDVTLDKLYAKNNLANGQRGIEIDNDMLERYPSKIDQRGTEIYDPRSLRFNRLAGSFKINSLTDDESYGFIGFTATHRGYELAIGSEVAVCSNMCIMNAENRASTFGNAKVGDIQKLMKKLEAWIENYKQIREADIQKIAEMKEMLIDIPKVQRAFGSLYEKIHTKGEMILGAHTLSKTQHYYVKEYLAKDRELTNVWDLYNLFTYNMKFDTLDFSNIFESNQKMMEYLLTLKN